MFAKYIFLKKYLKDLRIYQIVARIFTSIFIYLKTKKNEMFVIYTS